MTATLLLTVMLSQPPSSTAPKVTEVMPPVAAKAEESTARVGQLKRFSADTKARWELAAGTSGAEIVTDDKGGCVFVADRAGRYTLVCYTAGPATWLIITVPEGANPAPVPPNPTPVPPNPTPPAPPRPNPVVAAIKSAFEKDPGDGAQKRKDAVDLAALWEQGAVLAADPDIKTAGQLLERLRKASTLLAADRLTGTRRAISEATRNLFGTPDAELTATGRKAAAELFNLVSQTLEDIAK